jgi:hypothetical protein
VGDGDVADEIANGQGRVGGGGEQGGGGRSDASIVE